MDGGVADRLPSGGVRGRRHRGDHRREDGASLPQLGSVALQSGGHAGETIASLVAGKKTKPFKYHDKGTMATIGRGAAVVQMQDGKTMKGRKAQLAWGTVHLALLPDQRGPREGRGRLGGRRAHAPALGPDQGRYLGVRPGLHLDAVAGHREIDPTRSALAGTDRGAEVVAAGSAYRSAKPCRQLG